MFNVQTETKTITNEHLKKNEDVAYQVAQLIFHHETLWEDWTHPASIPLTCKEASNASQVS